MKVLAISSIHIFSRLAFFFFSFFFFFFFLFFFFFVSAYEFKFTIRLLTQAKDTHDCTSGKITFYEATSRKMSLSTSIDWPFLTSVVYCMQSSFVTVAMLSCFVLI